MDVGLISELLDEAESSYLDFKRDQYKFVKADDDSKSELLKDILAFANAWRRTDAYILIGVQEIKGGRSKVLGLKDHLDDHALQQFVHSKTQGPVAFSYQTVQLEGKDIGLLRIPIQTRPIYLLRDYGKLLKNVVYIRRGSSTDVASPEEIARMGVERTEKPQPPALDLKLGDVDSHEVIGSEFKITSRVLKLPPGSVIPDFGSKGAAGYLQTSWPNRSYYRELVDYFRKRMQTHPIGFLVMNRGELTAPNVRMKIAIERDEQIILFAELDAPDRPRRYYSIIEPPGIDALPTLLKTNLNLEARGSKWLLSLDFGNVQPKDESWSDESIFIGSAVDRKLVLKAQIYADNLPDPIRSDLLLIFETQKVDVDIAALEEVYEKEMRDDRDALSDQH